MRNADNNNKSQESSHAEGAKDSQQPAVGLSLPIEPPEHKHKRSTGLRLFDVLLYPVIANIGVFAISVGATYLTTKGGDKDAAGKLIYGKTGKFFQQRGEWLVGKFKKMGMTEQSADMSKMVFFSFADGSLMAPLVKLFEDKREKIGRWCDAKLGTTPSDPDVYTKEPKQSWTSVLGGRAVTAAVVVNTAVALNKTGLNDKLFINPGIKAGQWLKTKPKVAQFFGKYDVGELAKVSLFEAFYTSVCTVGLYVSSRFLARRLNKHKEEKEHAHHHATIENVISDNSAAAETLPAVKASETLRKSRPVASAANHLERYKDSRQAEASLSL